MNKLMTRITVLLATVALAAVAMAANAPLAGKVTRIDGTRVTVTAKQNIPSWVKKGGTVSALGGSPKVLEVKGKEMVLRFGKAKAETLKVDSAATVSESAGEELQGC